MGELQRLTPGQPISALSASTWERFRQATLGYEQSADKPDAKAAKQKPPAIYAELLNETGASRDAYNIVHFDENGLDWPADNSTFPQRSSPVCNANAPVSGERFAILQNGVESGNVNKVTALISGVAFCKVDIKDKDDTVCGAVDDQYTHLDSGTGSTPILASANSEEEDDEDKTGVQWCVVLLNGSGGSFNANTTFAVVTGTAAAATWSGSEDLDFKMCFGSQGTCLILNPLGSAVFDPSDWQASTAYDADEEWKATIAGGLTDPVDNNGTPLQEGLEYRFAYPTSQTSGAALNEAEYAKAVAIAEIPDSGDAECWGLPQPAEGETLADYELVLECLYDEVPLTKGRVIILSTDGPIPSGPYAEGQSPVVKGRYLRVTDYLRELSGFDEKKILWTPDGDEIEWKGGPCDE